MTSAAGRFPTLLREPTNFRLAVPGWRWLGVDQVTMFITRAIWRGDALLAG